eukprot:TRINITY_DN18310_c0_g1_i1.p1 TRINITY_DN18310_c0_g1~~TRINITY_DN18310_c0_g1_i1.p1  ORF type:complete len:783 (-),score=179.23 TRINITY_DN18310_c0_g1_i1:28-2328(-)
MSTAQFSSVFRPLKKVVKPVKTLFNTHNKTSFADFAAASKRVNKAIVARGFKRLGRVDKMKLKNIQDLQVKPHITHTIRIYQGLGGGSHWRDHYKRSMYLMRMVHRRVHLWKKYKHGRPFAAYVDFLPWRIMQWLQALSRVKWGLARVHLIEHTRRTNRNYIIRQYAKMARKIHKDPELHPELFKKVIAEMQELYGAPIPSDPKTARNQMVLEKFLCEDQLAYAKKHFANVRRRIFSSVPAFHYTHYYYRRNPMRIVYIGRWLARLRPKEEEIPMVARCVRWFLDGFNHFRLKRNSYSRDTLVHASLIMSVQFHNFPAEKRPHLLKSLQETISDIGDMINSEKDTVDIKSMRFMTVALAHAKLFDHPLFDSVGEQILKRDGFLFSSVELKEFLWCFSRRQALGKIEIPHDVLDEILFELLLESRRKFMSTNEFIKIMFQLRSLGIFHAGICQEILQRFAPTPGQPQPFARTSDLCRALKWYFDSLDVENGETLINGPITVDTLYFSIRRLRFVVASDRAKFRRDMPILKNLKKGLKFMQSCVRVGLNDYRLFPIIIDDLSLVHVDRRKIAKKLRGRFYADAPEDWDKFHLHDLKFARQRQVIVDRVRACKLKLDIKLIQFPEDKIGLRKKELRLKKALDRLKSFELFGKRLRDKRTRILSEYAKEFLKLPGVTEKGVEFLTMDPERSFQVACWWAKKFYEKVKIPFKKITKKEIVEALQERPGPPLWSAAFNPPVFKPGKHAGYSGRVVPLEPTIAMLNKAGQDLK